MECGIVSKAWCWCWNWIHLVRSVKGVGIGSGYLSVECMLVIVDNDGCIVNFPMQPSVVLLDRVGFRRILMRRERFINSRQL